MSWDVSKTYKWDKRYVSLAAHIAEWSKDPSRKIGAVAVGSKRQVLAQGYNGFPRGISDNDSMYENKVTKYQHVVHAEMNCIYNATLNGVSLLGASLYVAGLPICSECSKGIIQVGVERVVVSLDNNTPDVWSESWEISKEMFTFLIIAS